MRAGLVDRPETYPWSSAAAHCGTAPPDAILDMNFWQQNWNHSAWREFLGAQESAAEDEAIRQSTHTGRPLGTKEFIQTLEKAIKRNLAPKKGGRPEKSVVDRNQSKLDFD